MQIITIKDIFKNRLVEVLEYFDKIKGTKISSYESNHKRLLEQNDPVAMYVESITKSFNFSLKLIAKLIKKDENFSINLVCPICGKPIIHDDRIKLTCSMSCSAKKSSSKARETCLKKYGVSRPAQNKEIKEKMKRTNLERYGSVCSFQNDEVKEKFKQTMMEKYGVDSPFKLQSVKEKIRDSNLERFATENPFQAEEVKEKIKQTSLKRYGVDHISKADIIKEKKEKTNLEKYGVSEVLKSKEIRKKIENTNLEKYGTTTPIASEEVRNKSKETLLSRYGVDSPLKCEKIKEKFKKTSVEKYGFENPFQSEELKEKIRQTNLERHGAEYIAQTELYKERVRALKRQKRFDFFNLLMKSRNLELLSENSNYLVDEFLKFRCRRCGAEFEARYQSSDQSRIWCPKCHSAYSSGENSIYDFLCEILKGEEIQRNTRKILPDFKELDLYIPEHKLAIEHNGLYFHQAEFKDKDYHLSKTIECQKLGIRLLHIFENEWLYKKEIVKSIIRAKLNIFDRVVYARNCIVRALENKEYNLFLEENHLQGFVPSSIKLGLFNKDELVACIGIGKSRFKKNETELIRFCTKLNTKVVGGLSKLIKHSGITDLISYVDLRYFDGSGYTKAGFELIDQSKPGYVYVKDNQVLTRYQCQKHKLLKLLRNTFDPNLTEVENMTLAGYYQLYDCGMLKFQLKR